MSLIDYRVTHENKLIEEYLSKTTGKSLISIVEKHLIINNLQTIFENGFDLLIKQKDHDNLKRLYSFLKRVESIDFLKKNWNFYIKQAGTDIIL